MLISEICFLPDPVTLDSSFAFNDPLPSEEMIIDDRMTSAAVVAAMPDFHLVDE
jgi:hypothetical protein